MREATAGRRSWPAWIAVATTGPGPSTKVQGALTEGLYPAQGGSIRSATGVPYRSAHAGVLGTASPRWTSSLNDGSREQRRGGRARGCQSGVGTVSDFQCGLAALAGAGAPVDGAR